MAVVDGVKIQFYYDEHPPAHFHAEFAEYQAMINIETLELVEGRLPRRQMRKVAAWAMPGKASLFAAWQACRSDENPGKIP